MIFVGLKAYNGLRNQLGSLIVQPNVAHRNAIKVSPHALPSHRLPGLSLLLADVPQGSTQLRV